MRDHQLLATANELIYNPGNSQDESRRLAWLKDLTGVRVAFSNEMRLDGRGADGNLIKAISSGGDQHKVRGNYEDGRSIVNRATMFCLANDFVKVTPSPASCSGLQERLRFIRYVLQFVEEPKTANERLKNPEIKHLVKTDAWKNALFHVIWRCWVAMDESEKKIDGDLKTPTAVKAETMDWVIDGDGSLLDVLSEMYEVTNVFADTALIKDVVGFLIGKGLKYSPKKIGMEIRKIIQTRDWTEEQKGKMIEKRTGNKNVYHGIKLI